MLTEADGLRIKAIDAKIKQLTEEKDEILRQSKVRDLPAGTYQDGRVTVSVSEVRRFDSALAQEMYPFNEANLHLYDATISSAKAKKHLPPAVYQSLQKVYPNNKVEVKIND